MKCFGLFSSGEKQFQRVRKHTVVKFKVSLLNANKVIQLFLSASKGALSPLNQSYMYCTCM
jgi:hypothetical protein